MDSNFISILKDKTSGSSEILYNCFKYFKLKLSDGRSISDEVDNALNNLSHFTGIKSNLIQLQQFINSNQLQNAEKFINSLLEYEMSVYKNIYNSIPDELKYSIRIVTLSNSKTVFEVLKLWYKDQKELTVHIAESHPEKEGLILQQNLTNSNVSAFCFPDNELSSNIEKSDLLMLGCDSVYRNGNIINKTGSRDAAVIAAYFRKPVIAVTSRHKFNEDESNTGSIKSNFQMIESDLLTAIFTD